MTILRMTSGYIISRAVKDSDSVKDSQFEKTSKMLLVLVRFGHRGITHSLVARGYVAQKKRSPDLIDAPTPTPL